MQIQHSSGCCQPIEKCYFRLSTKRTQCCTQHSKLHGKTLHTATEAVACNSDRKWHRRPNIFVCWPTDRTHLTHEPGNLVLQLYRKMSKQRPNAWIKAILMADFMRDGAVLMCAFFRHFFSYRFTFALIARAFIAHRTFKGNSLRVERARERITFKF